MEAIAFVLIVPVALAAVLFLIGFWVWMLIDCLKNEPSEGNDKIVWLLVIVFTKIFGAAIYYFVRRPRRPQLHSSES